MNWQTQLTTLRVSVPLKRILQPFMPSGEALVVAERPLPEQALTLQDCRCTLLETVPALPPLSARG